MAVSSKPCASASALTASSNCGGMVGVVSISSKGQKQKRDPEGITFRASWSLLLPLALWGLWPGGL